MQACNEGQAHSSSVNMLLHAWHFQVINELYCKKREKLLYAYIYTYMFAFDVFHLWILFVCTTKGTVSFTCEYLTHISNYSQALQCMTKSLYK